MNISSCYAPHTKIPDTLIQFRKPRNLCGSSGVLPRSVVSLAASCVSRGFTPASSRCLPWFHSATSSSRLESAHAFPSLMRKTFLTGTSLIRSTTRSATSLRYCRSASHFPVRNAGAGRRASSSSTGLSTACACVRPPAVTRIVAPIAERWTSCLSSATSTHAWSTRVFVKQERRRFVHVHDEHRPCRRRYSKSPNPAPRLECPFRLLRDPTPS